MTGTGGRLTLSNAEAMSAKSKSGDDQKEMIPIQASQHPEDDQLLKSAKAEMGEVKEENEKLKSMLLQIMKDYKSLQMHFHSVVQQQEPPTKNTKSTAGTTPYYSHGGKEEEETELVSLSLGIFPSVSRKNEKKVGYYKSRKCKDGDDDDDDDDDDDGFGGEGLELGLDCRFDPGLVTAESMKIQSFDETKKLEEEEAATETTLPPSNTSLKMTTSSRDRDDDEDVLQQNPMKKARVSVKVVCDTQTMSDGCQWRKYGQKIAKGNPCPRAYYRCTVSPSCPVRKQVQRCCEDMSILITTYEGSHNHPLPVGASAMASATSAAASILKSSSSSSTSSQTSSISAKLHGLKFILSNNNSGAPLSQKPSFCLPKATISTSQSHPTITLDLTNNAFLSPPKYSSSNLNFSSSPSTPLSNRGGAGGGYLNYQTELLSTSKRASNLGKRLQNQEPLYFSNENYCRAVLDQPPSNLTDSVAAATQAIASNPTFRSALAVAISSYVGKTAAGGAAHKEGDQEFVPLDNPGYPSAQNTNRAWPSLDNNSQPSNLTLQDMKSHKNRAWPSLTNNSQPSNLTLFSSNSLSFSSSDRQCVSPANTEEHMK